MRNSIVRHIYLDGSGRGVRQLIVKDRAKLFSGRSRNVHSSRSDAHGHLILGLEPFSKLWLNVSCSPPVFRARPSDRSRPHPVHQFSIKRANSVITRELRVNLGVLWALSFGGITSKRRKNAIPRDGDCYLPLTKGTVKNTSRLRSRSPRKRQGKTMIGRTPTESVFARDASCHNTTACTRR